MKSQTPMGGRIINNGSLAAHVPRPNLPLEANVQFMTIMATKMPFIGRG